MVGANAGEVASQMAVTLIPAELTRTPAALARPESAPQAIHLALQVADEAIKRKATEPDFEGMGATRSLLCFVGTEAAYWSQAGDSRVYVCRRGELRQISRDHSPVGRLRQEGRITEEEARRHSQRNQIDQSLGDPIKPFQPDVGAEQLRPGDVFLVCSDGLSDGLFDREIKQLLAGVRSAVRPAVRHLVARAKEACGRDNITAVVALVENTEGETADAKPGLGENWRIHNGGFLVAEDLGVRAFGFARDAAAVADLRVQPGDPNEPARRFALGDPR